MLATRHEPASLDCEVADPFGALDAWWRARRSFRLGASVSQLGRETTGTDEEEQSARLARHGTGGSCLSREAEVSPD